MTVTRSLASKGTNNQGAACCGGSRQAPASAQVAPVGFESKTMTCAEAELDAMAEARRQAVADMTKRQVAAMNAEKATRRPPLFHEETEKRLLAIVGELSQMDLCQYEVGLIDQARKSFPHDTAVFLHLRRMTHAAQDMVKHGMEAANMLSESRENPEGSVQ